METEKTKEKVLSLTTAPLLVQEPSNCYEQTELQEPNAFGRAMENFLDFIFW